jgi:hypothetical protein
MKLRHCTPLILLFMFFSMDICEAQLLNRVKRTAERAASRVVERKVEREVEKAVERQIERSWISIFGEQTDAEGRPIDFGKIMGSMNMNVATEESYHFDGKAEMEISGKDEKGKEIEPMTMHSYLSKENPYTAVQMDNPEAEKMLMIFDTKNDATVILMEKDGERSSLAYSIDWEKMAEAMPEEDIDAEGQDFENLNFRKTGKTKTLLGQLCEEYEVETDDYMGSYWVTQEPLEGAANFWSNNSPYFNQKFKGKQQQQFENLPEGNILEMNYASKKDKSNMTFLIKDLDDNHSVTIHMSEYPNMMMAQHED